MTNISWTRRPGGVKVEIEADGAIRQGRFSYFRISGENPREVIKLKGVVQKYPQSVIPLTGSPVSRIRVGYHANKELHLVLDMLDSSTTISSVRTRGNTLEIFLE